MMRGLEQQSPILTSQFFNSPRVGFARKMASRLLLLLLLPTVPQTALTRAVGLPAAHAAEPRVGPIRDWARSNLPDLLGLYRHLHSHPELSLKEKETAERFAAELKSAGLEVSTNVGGHGVVGVLKNGTGPTVMVRTDLDAL
ncbi:MAG: amidohydrolase, partial [Planctomycetes bacterium]|nr:amidohydrolase [Planctomycetota bacterium]